MIEESGDRLRTTLDPKIDIVFWMLFSAEQNRELLLSLLNAVLRPTKPIVSVELLHAQPERTDVTDKSIALDLRVRLDGGEQVDVEMQSQRRPAQPKRVLYYWSRLYAGQLPRGADYSALRRCAVVLITDYKELATARFHSVFEVRERHDAALLTDQLELHLVELPKLHDALDRNDEPSLTDWAKFLAARADKDLEALAMQNPVLKQAKDALDSLSADPRARAVAEMREMALISYNLHLSAAKEEGEAEGRAKGEAEGRAKGEAEGRAKGQAEMLLRVLVLKFGEVAPEVRQRVMAATVGELEAWCQLALSAPSLAEVFSPPPAS
jgi:predicted transposase/invertase (TIGR01784 family)